MLKTHIDNTVSTLAAEIKNNFSNQTHPNYGLHLLYAVWQAKLCGYEKITAIEFGVAGGGGLQELKKYAQEFTNALELEIIVAGFDTGKGLPAGTDYRDHFEIWNAGDYAVGDLPDVIYGDVKDTLPDFISQWDDSVLGFVSLDMDLYSSTVSALPIFEMPPDNYLPGVLVHLDDANTILTMNPWSGAELALNEFNNKHQLRKFEQKHRCWNLHNMHVLHVLDHPIRNGTQKPLWPLGCYPL